MLVKMRKFDNHAFALAHFINTRGFKRFVEVGVWRGRTCRRILKATSLEQYWAVDPWEVMDQEYATPAQRRKEKWQWDAYHQWTSRLMLYFPPLRVLRTTSKIASEIFPDKYLDIVYIDGVHIYEHVWDDISFWLPKIRKGGIIAGHDYAQEDVAKAVHAWFGDDIEVFETLEVWVKEVE